MRLPKPGGMVSICLSESKHNQNSGNSHAHPGKPVVEASVERGVAAEVVGQVRGAPHIACEHASDVAIRVDRGANAAVRVAHDPAAVFDGTDTDHAKVLLGSFGLAEPSVIREVEQELGATSDKRAHFHCIDSFIANEDGKGIAARQLSDGAVPALVEPADFFGDAGHDLMDKGKGLVFTKGDEMNFVVRENALAAFAEHGGAVVREQDGMLGPLAELAARFPLDDPNNDGTAKVRGKAGNERTEAWVLEGKWRGGFGPNKEVRLLRTWGRAQA